ncbi:hypothetical protein CFC21_065250 [Triticum aestivum]|uniref:Uncharacterized protein n=3 Tax=Triticum TaxID=4564 RepID=A0A9R0WLH2_TRITD|nr:hypothetical protein CFC21_065250 [Triticum aestivum]VAI16036.1 unnamed protein product [Triticum turgidum subsp. durum]
MGRYIMRTGSMGLGSMRFTSPRMTGHRHRSERSSTAAVLLRNMPSPLQHSLCGVGVSGSLPVRNDAHVISPASGVTQSAGDDADPPPLPGCCRPGNPGSGCSAGCEGAPLLTHGGLIAGDDCNGGGGDGGGEDGLKRDAGGDATLPPGTPGKPGLRCLPPGNPGNRSSSSSAPPLLAAASDDCAASTIAATAITTSARLDHTNDDAIDRLLDHQGQMTGAEDRRSYTG